MCFFEIFWWKRKKKKQKEKEKNKKKQKKNKLYFTLIKLLRIIIWQLLLLTYWKFVNIPEIPWILGLPFSKWNIATKVLTLSKFNLPDKIKCEFFQFVAVSVLLYGRTTWILTKC